MRAAVEQGKPLSELTQEELAELAPELDAEFYELLQRRGVARVQGLRGRHGAARACATSSPRRATCWRGERLSGAPLAPPPRLLRPARCSRWRADLVGCVLRHGDTAGRIVETEAYHETEPACHAYIGLTAADAGAVRPARARAYVYRSYGIHALLNAVSEAEGVGAAVLIRALEPLEGLDLMRERRGLEPREDLCSGPGKLTQALGIGLDLNGTRARRPDRDAAARPGPGARIVAGGTRIGITRAVDLPWRFCDAASRCVSRPWPHAMRRRGGARPERRRGSVGRGAAARPAAGGRRRASGAGACGVGVGRVGAGSRRGAARACCGCSGVPSSGVAASGSGAVPCALGVRGPRPARSGGGRGPLVVVLLAARRVAPVADADPGAHEVVPDLGREGAAGHRARRGTRSS